MDWKKNVPWKSQPNPLAKICILKIQTNFYVISSLRCKPELPDTIMAGHTGPRPLSKTTKNKRKGMKKGRNVIATIENSKLGKRWHW